MIVATPLGNLEDLSARAAKSLAEAGIVAAEDTRRTRKLLSHLGISPRLISCREHNEAKVGPKLIEEIKAGVTVALVSDAGTPGLSDPGARLVAAAHAAGIRVEPIPGPSAVAAALSVSGLGADAFTFAGFPPAKAGARKRFLAGLADRAETLVFYEAPHRLAASLRDMAAILGPRSATLCRELTKLHEEIRSADLDRLARWAAEGEIKGEITLVVAGAEKGVAEADPQAVKELWRRLRAEGLSASQAAREAAARLGLSRAEVYRLGLEEDGS